jgi:hypothetical protein
MPQNNQRDPQERPDGWYWVRWAAISTWTVCEWQDGEWLEDYPEHNSLPFKIGPRIPSPDEPAPSERPEEDRDISIHHAYAEEALMFKKRCDALESELAKLRVNQMEDLERLVLRSPCASIQIDAQSNGDQPEWQISILIDGSWEGGQATIHVGPTLREAIDAARAARKAGE